MAYSFIKDKHNRFMLQIQIRIVIRNKLDNEFSQFCNQIHYF